MGGQAACVATQPLGRTSDLARKSAEFNGRKFSYLSRYQVRRLAGGRPTGANSRPGTSTVNTGIRCRMRIVLHSLRVERGTVAGVFHAAQRPRSYDLGDRKRELLRRSYGCGPWKPSCAAAQDRESENRPTLAYGHLSIVSVGLSGKPSGCRVCSTSDSCLLPGKTVRVVMTTHRRKGSRCYWKTGKLRTVRRGRRGVFPVEYGQWPSDTIPPCRCSIKWKPAIVRPCSR